MIQGETPIYGRLGNSAHYDGVANRTDEDGNETQTDLTTADVEFVASDRLTGDAIVTKTKGDGIDLGDDTGEYTVNVEPADLAAIEASTMLHYRVRVTDGDEVEDVAYGTYFLEA